MENKEILKKEIQWLLKEKYKDKKTAAFKKDVEELKKGTPLAYVIGFVDFLDCKIKLNKYPLIPRAETELWTEKAIKDIQKNRPNALCLDIFAGSGCIGIALLKKLKNVKVDFAEISNKFNKQILENLEVNKIKKDRYNLIKSNVFDNIDKKYDYILANPPYVAKKDKQQVQSSVFNFEPCKALFSGSDGLKLIKNFLLQSKKHLKREGKIYLEFGINQKKKLPQIIEKAGFKKYSFFKDQYDRWRWVVIRKN